MNTLPLIYRKMIKMGYTSQHDITLTKANRLSIKKAKEIEKKQKIQEQIKAASDKLAKLQAKLGV